MTDKQVGYICKHSGSPDILFDAFASWDYINQRMELSTTYDHCGCLNCGGEDSQIEVDMETYKKALEREVTDG